MAALSVLCLNQLSHAYAPRHRMHLRPFHTQVRDRVPVCGASYAAQSAKGLCAFEFHCFILCTFLCRSSMTILKKINFEKIAVILVGTQSDLRANVSLVIDLCKNGEQPVSELKARMLSEELCADYLECSALTQQNLKEVFDAAILTALRSKASSTTTATYTTNPLSMSRGLRGFLSSGNDRDEKKSSKFRQGFKRIVTFTKRLL